MIGTSKYEIKEVLLDMKSERAFFRAKKVKNKLLHKRSLCCKYCAAGIANIGALAARKRRLAA